jgi:hypothetical protein
MADFLMADFLRSIILVCRWYFAAYMFTLKSYTTDNAWLNYRKV